MKKNLLFLAFSFVLIYACTKKNSTPDMQNGTTKAVKDFHNYALLGLDSPFISTDSANKMLASFQGSIGTNGDDLQALIVDADALRYYLSNDSIKHIKLMFAHKLSYIRAGNINVPAGYKNNALTIVIAGYGDNGNYIYSPQGAVMDFCLPCPSSCPESGNAAYNVFPK